MFSFRFFRQFSPSHIAKMKSIYEQGTKHFEKKEWAKAHDCFDQIVKEEPHQKGARVRSAISLRELEKENKVDPILKK